MIHYLQKPVYQLLIIQILSVVTWLIISPGSVNQSWTIMGLFYVGFIVINSIFIWNAEERWKYFFISIGVSLLYILVSGGLVTLLNKLRNLDGSGESGMIFLAVIYHPFTLMLVILVKWIFKKS